MVGHDRGAAAIDKMTVSAYSIPTEAPETDGTARWDKTVLVLVEVEGCGMTGIGYTYADVATAHFAHEHLCSLIVGRELFAVSAMWVAMCVSIRNLGRPGVASMAISAIDAALWDLKAKVLHLPLFHLLGATRAEAPIYGSGGFTSYSTDQLQRQLGDWAAQGIPRVKMKVGSHPEQDVGRVRIARKTIGDAVELYVDANGAYARKQALGLAQDFAQVGVKWFEEPVSSDDLAGLRLLRDHAPAGMDIAAGEYGYESNYFRRMLAAGAVDVLQADASRCGGVTGFLKAADLCAAFHMPFSSHCAPALHVHLACAVTADFRHLEFFYDHNRVENMLFDGIATPVNGALHPDPARPGLGLEFKHKDAERFRVWTAEHNRK